MGGGGDVGWGGGGAKQKQSDKIMLVTIKNPKGAPAAPLSPPNFSGVGTALVALPWVPHSAPTHGAEPPPMHGRDKPSIPPSIPALELNGSNTNVITGSSSRVSQVTHPRAGGCSTEPRPPPPAEGQHSAQALRRLISALFFFLFP